MKTYKISKPFIFFFIIFLLIIASLLVFVLIMEEQFSYFSAIAAFLFLYCYVLAVSIMLRIEVVLYDDRMEYFYPRLSWFLNGKLSKRILFWKDIKEITSFYVLYPEQGCIAFNPQHPPENKKFEIMAGLFSIQALRDILSHVPKTARVHLYPYLQRKLEGKQTWFYNQ